MGDINIDIKGLRELKLKLQQLQPKVEKSVTKKALRQGVNVFTAAARALAPVKTGSLRKSIKTKSLRGKPGVPVFATYTTSKYAHLVERGTSQHLIQAGTKRGVDTGKKVLANGGIIYGKSVNHPGSKMRPFMRPAFDENTDKAIEVFRQTLADNIKDLI